MFVSGGVGTLKNNQWEMLPSSLGLAADLCPSCRSPSSAETADVCGCTWLLEETFQQRVFCKMAVTPEKKEVQGSDQQHAASQADTCIQSLASMSYRQRARLPRPPTQLCPLKGPLPMPAV